MRKSRYLLLFTLILLMLATVFFTGCDLSSLLDADIGGGGGDTDGADQEFTVKFVYNNGYKSKSVSVGSSGILTEPDEPVRSNYIFIGWYTDEKLENPHSFENKLTKDVTLYARWIPDYEKITNDLMQSKMRANVMVKTTATNFGLVPGSSNSSTAKGSGIIYKYESGYYYALTNNHVVSLEGDKVEYTLYDCYLNSYACEVLFSDVAYDLAVVKFKAGNVALETIDFSEGMPDENEPVIALGQPRGQMNAVTYGEILDFEKIEMKQSDKAESNVSFEVLWHSADIFQGSSGGALLNLDFELVGLNFATSYDEGGQFAYGFAVSTDKILEFLELYS